VPVATDNNFTHNFDRDSETSASERETQRL